MQLLLLMLQSERKVAGQVFHCCSRDDEVFLSYGNENPDSKPRFVGRGTDLQYLVSLNSTKDFLPTY